MNAKREKKKVTCYWDWRRNCQEERKICAVNRIWNICTPFHWFHSDIFVLFYMNENIIMEKYKGREDNVIWAKEDVCPPSPFPWIFSSFRTLPPLLFSAHWPRKCDWIIWLHYVISVSCQISAQTSTEFCFTQTAVVWSRVIYDIVNLCMLFCDIDGTFRFPWGKKKEAA